MSIELSKDSFNQAGKSSQPRLCVSKLRQNIGQELHNRPSAKIAISTSISHLALRVSQLERHQEFVKLCALCNRYNVIPPAHDACCYYQHFKGFDIRLERHLEFSSYTFIRAGVSPGLFDGYAIECVPQQWFDELVGELVSAVNVVICDSALSEQQHKKTFEGSQVLGSHVAKGRASVFTSFRLHSDGFGRLYIQSHALNEYQAGRLIQRLLEIETYQMMALLSLPIARGLAPKVADMEQRLVSINQKMAQVCHHDDGQMLESLSSLASQTEQLIADISYRFSATNAYYELVCTRLEQLKEEDICGVEGIGEFVTRRLSPGIRTCQALTHRLNDLTCRIERASALLRTRVDLSIEQQNQKLLQAINHRGAVQLRLQQMVEGVSIVAIVYYSMGLLDYLLDALNSAGWPTNKTIVKGAAVPVFLLFTWLIMRFVVKVIKKQPVA